MPVGRRDVDARPAAAEQRPSTALHLGIFAGSLSPTRDLTHFYADFFPLAGC